MDYNVLDHIVFKTVSGSRSYGLDTSDSDKDALGAFVSPPGYLLGVNDENVRHYQHDTDDENYKLMSDFALNIRIGSHFWVETLFVRDEDILVLSPVFEPFVTNRKMFLTQNLVTKSLGFMRGMITDSQNTLSKHEPSEKNWSSARKNLCHAVRVGNMILEMLNEFDMRVYRLDEREHLLGIKYGLVSSEDAISETEFLISKIEERKNKVNLFEDNALINDWLVQGYIKYWRSQNWI